MQNDKSRTDPGSEPSPRSWNPILKKPEGLEENSVLGILGRFFSILGAIRLRRISTKRFLSFHLVPQEEKSPPPEFHRRLSTSSPKGLLPGEGPLIEKRDGSREPPNLEVQHPSQSQISHEFPQLSHGGVDRRSNREILLSVERDSKEKVFLAGSREPTLADLFLFAGFRKEVAELRIHLAQDPQFEFGKFPILFEVLRSLENTVPPLDLDTAEEKRTSRTDTPEPGENTTSSDPNLVQGDHRARSPESPSPGTTGETEGERR